MTEPVQDATATTLDLEQDNEPDDDDDDNQTAGDDDNGANEK